MNQTQGLERPGAHESAVTGNHIYEKTSHRDGDDPRRRRGGQIRRSRRTSARKAWSEDSRAGSEPEARRHRTETWRGRDRDWRFVRSGTPLRGALGRGRRLLYCAGFLPNEAEIGKSMVDAARGAGMRRRAVLPLMKRTHRQFRIGLFLRGCARSRALRRGRAHPTRRSSRRSYRNNLLATITTLKKD
jgi:hypothetical protein